MPFKSKAQQRLFFSKNSPVSKAKAREWAHETKNIKRLPEHAKKKKKRR